MSSELTASPEQLAYDLGEQISTLSMNPKTGIIILKYDIDRMLTGVDYNGRLEHIKDKIDWCIKHNNQEAQ